MAKRTRPKQLAAFLDNYRAATLLILAALFSVSLVGQTVPQVNNVPWYEFAKKLSVGKLQVKQAGEYDTSFTIPSIAASLVLDTITEDKTVTFPDISATTDKAVIIYLLNTNSSGFVWNVVGNVKESETGDAISTISRGLHIFYWTGAYWSRLKTGGGSTPATDTNTVIYPITMLNRAIGIDPDGLPEDTAFVALHGTTLWNVLYRYDGVRDSTVIGDIATEGGGGGGVDTIYVEQQGATGDSIVWAKNDSTIAAVRVRDSTGIETGYAPDGAFYIKAALDDYFQNGGNSFGGSATIGTNDANHLIFETNGSERARISSTGQFFWKTTSTAGTIPVVFNDSVQVLGLRVGAALTGAVTNPLIGGKTANASTSDYALNFENTSGTILLRVRNDGAVTLGNTTISTSGMTTPSNSTYLFNIGAGATQTGQIVRFQGVPNTITSGTASFVDIGGTAAGGVFAPTSGTGVYNTLEINGIINQTGGASGITRGIWVDQTLTSAANYRAIQTTVTSNVFGKIEFKDSSVVTTTNATPTTIVDIPLTLSPTEMEVDVSIKAKSGSDYAFYRRMIRVVNVGGTLTVKQTQTIGTDHEDAALSSADINVTTSGTKIIVQAVGIAATTIDWQPVWRNIRY